MVPLRLDQLPARAVDELTRLIDRAPQIRRLTWCSSCFRWSIHTLLGFPD